MNKKIISQIIGVITILAGITVMFGWFFDITVLKSILPGWVTMKFITAVCFVFSGVLIFLISLKEKGQISKFFILIISFTMLLLMTIFFLSLFFNISTGIETLFVQEQVNAVRTTVPGVPAIPTMICFILISIEGLIFMYNTKSLKPQFWLGILIALIGFVALIGYLINVPIMYYSFKGFTAMAFPTAILFTLLGIASIITGMKEKDVGDIRRGHRAR